MKLSKIKKIKKIDINGIKFKITWDKKSYGASFGYNPPEILIGTARKDQTFMIICHELMEIAAIELHVRHQRPDVDSDYIFVYDHRQFDTMMQMFSGWIKQFIKG